MQGVWGAARPPSEERDGYPLGVEPARMRASAPAALAVGRAREALPYIHTLHSLHV